MTRKQFLMKYTSTTGEPTLQIITNWVTTKGTAIPTAIALGRHKTSFTFLITIIDPFLCRSSQILELIPYFKPLIFLWLLC